MNKFTIVREDDTYFYYLSHAGTEAPMAKINVEGYMKVFMEMHARMGREACTTSPATEQKCNCDRFILCNFGCKCGGK